MNKSLFLIIDNLLEVIISFNYLLKFSNNKWRENTKSFPYIVILIIYIYAANYINSFSGLIMILQGIIYYFCIRSFKVKISKIKAAFSSALLVVTLIIVSTMVLTVGSKVLGLNFKEIISSLSIEYVLVCAGNKILLMGCLTYFIYFGRYIDAEFSIKDSILLLSVPAAVVIVMSALTNIMAEQVLDFKQSVGMALLIICVMFVIVLQYQMYIRLTKNKKAELELSLLKQKNEFEKVHVNECINMYSKIKSIRHDLKNYMLCVGNFLAEGKYKPL